MFPETGRLFFAIMPQQHGDKPDNEVQCLQNN